MLRVTLFLHLFALLAGCSLLPRSPAATTARSESSIQPAAHESELSRCTLYVVGNGFHTGLVLRTADVPRDAWPEVDQIPAHPWVEVGWGSEIFYRAKSITAPVVVGAVLPNASVLHVVGWDTPPERTFVGDLVRMEVDAAHLAALCRHIHETYARDADGRVEHLGPGIYGDGAFFRARGKYYFPNTCNVWTAQGLEDAGLPIVPELCSAGDTVLLFARHSGSTIKRR